MTNRFAGSILGSRKSLVQSLPHQVRSDEAAEGGCGVLGFAASLPVAGKHVLQASRQMHNRGNGKGGGIAMAGLDPGQAGISADILRSHTLLQIALLDEAARGEVEAGFIYPQFEVAQAYALDHVEDLREVPGLEVRPPEVWRYFVRPKPGALDEFAVRNGLEGLPERALQDEFVYQNSFALNRRFYASLGEKQAFVLSHGRDLSVLKIVGYAEDVVAYYRLEEQTANVWIAHQRYPTKGRVWHPGGAHPFIGLNEALVHNGDFANYHAVGEYLRQRGIGQLFLTDTEVSAQLFDLWDRVYGYPLEITLEAMAPTTEHDFAMLPEEKQALYQAVQRTHIHGSPDGPWFFIVARSQVGLEDSPPAGDRYELLGITDTSMLRPQVFALYENLTPQDGSSGVQIGLIASERQAIQACLRSLAAEDARFQPHADHYWAARGGSHTNGGAFRFCVERSGNGATLSCSDKFGREVKLEDAARGRKHLDRRLLDPELAAPTFRRRWEMLATHAYDDGGAITFFDWLRPEIKEMDWNELAWGLGWLCDFACSGSGEWRFSLESLNLLHDRRYDTGRKRRASVLAIIDGSLERLFALPAGLTGGDSPLAGIRRTGWESREGLRAPEGTEELLILDGRGFPPDGEQAAARWISRAAAYGWRQIIAYGFNGGRFAGCGLGPATQGLRLDLYGDVGDYAASGLDGAEVVVHGTAQDQVGQILKQGRLVVHGDVGQTFLYGAKGGDIFVLGSAAGRPLINAVGAPRAVINGTCLDYLAESFMAGDPLRGGGFVILNGVTLDETGTLVDLDSPYPGGNLFSLASGGAIYVRDPHGLLDSNQLNGGVYSRLAPEDWALVEPYLQENERLFGIRVQDLLRVEGQTRRPEEVYRKVSVDGGGLLRDLPNTP